MKLFLRSEESPVYDSARHQTPVLDELQEIFRYRELLTKLVSRNIKTRYKRSVLGIAWTMLSPLMMMIVMTLVFSNIFRMNLEHYPVYLLSGLVFWNFFAQTTSSAMNELVWGGSLMTRIYMPRSIFAFTALGTGLVNIVLSLIPLLLIMLATGAPLRLSLLFLPVSILIVGMFALGVGLFLSTLGVYFTDVLEMYQIVLMAWMYFTPIIYPIEIIPESYIRVFYLNPLYYLLEVFRQPIYLGKLPDLQTLAMACSLSSLTLIIGWWFFTRKADEFAYRV
jgi:ABC-type polysaccharide/polyol phosphate export permease